MKLIIFILLTLGVATSCNAQNKEKNMEKYNFELVNKHKGIEPVGIMRNGWMIFMYQMNEEGAYYREYPPAPEFYRVVKTFYPNGNLRYIGKYVGESLEIGESIYYNEDGTLDKIVDEDAKFGKIKLDDLLNFLDKEGHINLKTGEGREYGIIQEDGSGISMDSYIFINLIERESEEYWSIIITADPINDFYETSYLIDPDTGEVVHKETEQRMPVH